MATTVLRLNKIIYFANEQLADNYHVINSDGIFNKLVPGYDELVSAGLQVLKGRYKELLNSLEICSIT